MWEQLAWAALWAHVEAWTRLWWRGKDKGHTRPGFGGAGQLPLRESLQRARSREWGDDGWELQPHVERWHRRAPPLHPLCPGPPSVRCPPSSLLCRHPPCQLQTQDLQSGVTHSLKRKSSPSACSSDSEAASGLRGWAVGWTVACSRTSYRAGWLCLSLRTEPRAASAVVLASGFRAALLAGISGRLLQP